MMVMATGGFCWHRLVLAWGTGFGWVGRLDFMVYVFYLYSICISIDWIVLTRPQGRKKKVRVVWIEHTTFRYSYMNEVWTSV